MKNDESRTRKHNNAQDGEEGRITVVSPASPEEPDGPKPGDKKFHPAFNSKGERIRGVYFRVLSDGRKSYYARFVDPKTGKPTWQVSRDGSASLAARMVEDAENAVGEERANAYHEAIAATSRRTDGWTIGRVLDEYPKAAEARRAVVGKPSLATQKTQLGRARRILKGHEGENVSRVPELVLAYAVRWNREHGGVPTVTAAGEAQQVRAVFAPWVLEACERAGMPHAEMRWREIAQPAFQYELPPKELRERTIASGKEELAKGTDVGMAFMLEFFCAMSAADAIRARWDWLGPDDTVRYARHKTTKCAAPRIPQEIAFRWRELAAKSDSPFVLPFKAPSRRHSFLLKDFADWMTALGWTTKKKGHELRKLMCSIWYTTPGIGAEWTQAWSGDSLEVLQKHYARLLPEKAPPAPNV